MNSGTERTQNSQRGVSFFLTYSNWRDAIPKKKKKQN